MADAKRAAIETFAARCSKCGGESARFLTWQEAYLAPIAHYKDCPGHVLDTDHPKYT